MRYLLASLTCLTLAFGAWADDVVLTPQPMPQNPKMTELAKQCNVTPDELAAMRSQRMGWGEIGQTLAISQKAGVAVNDILALRQSKMSWNQIAQKYGFKVGAVVGRAREIKLAGQKAERVSANQMGSADHAGSGNHMATDHMGDHMESGHMGSGDHMGGGMGGGSGSRR